MDVNKMKLKAEITEALGHEPSDKVVEVFSKVMDCVARAKRRNPHIPEDVLLDKAMDALVRLVQESE